MIFTSFRGLPRTVTVVMSVSTILLYSPYIRYHRVWGHNKLRPCGLSTYYMYIKQSQSSVSLYLTATMAQWVSRWSRKRKVGCSKLSRNKPNSLKQVLTAPLLNARQKV